MSLPFESFILVAAILLIAVMLVGVGIVIALRNTGKNKDKSPVDGTPAPEWVKSVAGAAGKSLTRTESIAAPPDAILVLRDAASGKWQVEVNGMRYDQLRDIHDDKAAAKVLEALGGLQQFAGGIPLVAPAAAPANAVPAASPAEHTPAGPSVPIGMKLEPTVAAALSAVPTSKPKYPAPPGSILDQIEKVLQRNVLQDPELSQRRIHVGASADGSLLIEVDHTLFKSADEVTDERARQIIKSSIQEWERTA